LFRIYAPGFNYGACGGNGGNIFKRDFGRCPTLQRCGLALPGCRELPIIPGAENTDPCSFLVMAGLDPAIHAPKPGVSGCPAQGRA